MVLTSLIAFALLAQPQGPDLAKKVTLTGKVERLELALKDLSAKSGVKLTALPDIGAEVVFLQTPEATVSDVMNRIASAVGGVWVAQSEGFRLENDDLTLKRRDKEALSTLAAGIAKSIADMVADSGIAKTYSTDEAVKVLNELKSLGQQMQQQSELAIPDAKVMKRQAQLQSANPAARMLARALSGIDPSLIAGLPDGGRMVFASSPNRMQRALPNGDRILRQMVDESKIWTDALAQMPDASEEGSMYLSPFNGFFTQAAPAKVILSIQSFGGYGSGFNAEIKILDVDGRLKASYSQGLNWSDDGFDDLWKPEPDIANGFEFSATTRTLAQLLNPMREMGPVPNLFLKLPAETRDRLLNPIDNEPLAYLNEEGLTKLAGEDSSVIAVVPDDAYAMVMFAQGAERMGVERYEKLLSIFAEKKLDRSQKGWVTLSGGGWNARKTRMDRTELARFLSVVRNNDFTLDDFAAYVTRNPSLTMDKFGLMYPTSLFPTLYMTLEISDIDSVRFYGSLSNDQRNALARGDVLRVGGLGARQQDLLTKMAYSGNFYGQTFAFSEQDKFPEGQPEESSAPDLGNEPTELLPNGIPPAGMIRMKETRIDAAVPSGDTGFTFALDAESLGSQLAMQEKPEIFTWMNEMPISKTFYPARRRSLEFTFQYSDRYTQSRTVGEVVKTSKVPIALESFPAAFRTAVEDALKKARELYKNMKPGDMEPPPDGSGPPPTR